MLAYYTKRSQGEVFEKLSNPHKTNMWVDGNHLSERELEDIVIDYDLNRNIVYDVQDKQELSRIEYIDSTAYVFLRAPHTTQAGHVSAHPTLIAVRHDLFLTLSTGDTYAPEIVASTTLPLDINQTSDLLLGVIATCVSSYHELIKHTERSINDTGSRLKTHEVNNNDFIHFVTVEDNLMTFRVNLEGIFSVVSRLAEGKRITMSTQNIEALDDISQHIKQLLVAVESHQGRVSSIRSAYSTIADTNLNKRMKTLTVVTVLITLPNIVYGMFGMNVVLPFGKSPFGYIIVVSSSILLTVCAYIVGKQRKLF